LALCYMRYMQGEGGVVYANVTIRWTLQDC